MGFSLASWQFSRTVAALIPRGKTRGSKFLRSRRSVALAALVIGFGLLVAMEMRFSWIQSRIFAALDARITYTIGPGPSTRIHYPKDGPYDVQLGYAELPLFIDRLRSENYEIKEQARDSRWSLFLSGLGIYHIYHEKSQTGLDILDDQRRILYQNRTPQTIYPDFESIPPLVVRTLLFIENRHLLDESEPNRNPAIEWGRLGHAIIDFSLHSVNRRRSTIGGSTLATQLEKLRHSSAGKTHSAGEKLRQVSSAMLRSYQDGPKTLNTQRRIIRDYINSIPLAATPNRGEVEGLGDGLAAWFGADFDEANHLLGAEEDSLSLREMEGRANAYRQVLSLLLALRQPSNYLVRAPVDLDFQTDRYLKALCDGGVISRRLRDLALRGGMPSRRQDARPIPADFVSNKAADAVRAQLLRLLGLRETYVLNRLDLSVHTTIDQEIQQSVTNFFQQIASSQNLADAGLYGDRLLSIGDPGQVIYSFTLYEHRGDANFLRAQTDNLGEPLSVVDGTRLQLGSTAKLRTLISYLQIVEKLHSEYDRSTPSELSMIKVPVEDRLTSWALQYLSEAQDHSLGAMLNAALDREYSGDPSEVFFTAGGRHVFENFERSEDNGVMTVRDGFEQSVNLVFIRVMRDIEEYYKWRVTGVSSPKDLDNRNRERYLKRFADEEGSVFLRRLYARYFGLDADQALDALTKSIRPSPVRLAVIFRSVRPAAGYDSFRDFMRLHLPPTLFPDHELEKLYVEYAPDKFSSFDRGYLVGVNPLELWLVGYLQREPHATLGQVLSQSGSERIDASRWLFEPNQRRAQDLRIGILLEEDAFHEIWKSWKRLGYPFESLVPSYATAIGVSGDTPRALAELAGIIMSGGVRYPVETITTLTFASNTPTETTLAFQPSTGETLLSPVIASLVYKEMLGVVKNGTGRRAFRAFKLHNGDIVPVAGKTGTGDNRFKLFAPGGEMIADHPINRTAVFVFIIGDRFFGTVMAFVPGKNASSFNFTSALAVQILRDFAPILQPLLSQNPEKTLVNVAVQ